MTKMAIVFEPHSAVDPSAVLDDAKDWLYDAGFIKLDQLDEVYVLADYREPTPSEPKGVGAVVRVTTDGWSAPLHYVRLGNRKWTCEGGIPLTWGEVVGAGTTVRILSQGIDL